MTNPVPELTAVTVFEGNGSIIVKYELSGPVPQDDTFLVGVHGKSRDGKILRQFGVKFHPDESAKQFVFDHNAVMQENFDYVPATEDTDQIHTAYSSAHFLALGEDPQLRGYLNHAGRDLQTEVQVETVR